MKKRIGKEMKNVHILTKRYIMKHVKKFEQNTLSPVQIDIIEYLATATDKVYQKDLEKELSQRY